MEGGPRRRGRAWEVGAGMAGRIENDRGQASAIGLGLIEYAPETANPRDVWEIDANPPDREQTLS